MVGVLIKEGSDTQRFTKGPVKTEAETELMQLPPKNTKDCLK